jgi:TonB family protein
MNEPFLLDNLLANLIAWSAQICVLVAVGGLAALTLKHPRARLIFWQGLLAIALLLPAVEPWSQVVLHPVALLAVATPVAAPPGSPAALPLVTWNAGYLLAVFVAGALLRGLWIAAGFLRLRRHRLAARVLADPPIPFERSHVRWYISDSISGPVTFGWLRPSILLPERVNRLPADLREAIACHELVHVRRRDWLFVLAEEAIRGLLWFHPAIWFVLSRIQLAREQVVDLEVVRLTRDRDRYLDALLAVAAHKIEPDVAPAPLFLKKRQLAVRVAAVIKETSMSKSRMVASLTTVCSAALIAARLAVWFFPLQSPAQPMPSDGPGITVDAGAKLMHRAPVLYPRGASATGTVVLEATLNSKGEVSDARVLSGPDELRKAAIQSVLQWHYATDAGAPPTVQVSIKFAEARPAMPPSAKVRVPIDSPRIMTPQAASQAAMILKGIQFFGTTPDLEQRVRERLPVREGDQLMPDSLGKIQAAAAEVDEHFMVGMSENNFADGRREMTVRISLGAPLPPPPPPPPAKGVVGGIINGVPGGVVGGVPLPAAQATTANDNPQRIRVGGNVQAANLLVKVTPAYPPLAKQARIQGTVRFTVIIGKDGSIENMELISGHPLLVPSATDAVRQWVYKPTLLNGQPVEVMTQVDVNYTLSDEQQQ